ncbi:metalloregulator ArsR/SmtB family transcription factor [Thalassospiraceae bacterium LMO-SO8]|nr:metalloregulator ArsR/SmtB family transcription factor [Alphaproteobacteria bacterium LMO-S08]WND75857.1 metalloregulator ArsR/SmtB family transcription factor [Thalassospiraceae bacterium LMO-SO8]
MNEAIHVALFAALAQEHRLAVFRLLMREGPNGLPAGDIARRLDVAPSTLSAHLAQLCQAGLLRAARRRQSIFYAIDVEGTRRLIAYLTDDCCEGRPEICGYGASLDCGPAKETNDA